MPSMIARLLSCIAMSGIVRGQSVGNSCALPKQSKRGAAMLQSPLVETASTRPEPSSDSGVYVVPLQRMSAKPDEHQVNKGKAFFVGNVTVGYPPQRFLMLFDTSSGHTFIPHRICKSKACVEHNRFSSLKSITAEDIDFNGSRVQKQHRLAVGKVLRDSTTTSFAFADFGSGKAKALLQRDRVCLTSVNKTKVCAWPGINMVIDEEDTPFRAMPNDGILGLGLSTLSSSPVLSFFDKLIRSYKDMSPQFGFSLTPSGGELHIGGQRERSLAAPLQWFPVHSPEEGYWQVPILAVKLGDLVLHSCQNGCHAIVDTSAARLGVQKSNVPKLRSAIGQVTKGHDGLCDGPPLTFELGGMTITLGPNDYMDKPDDETCELNVGSLDVDEPRFVGLYVFGEIVLQHYYVAFNWQEKAIGFAPTATDARSRKPGADVEQIFM